MAEEDMGSFLSPRGRHLLRGRSQSQVRLSVIPEAASNLSISEDAKDGPAETNSRDYIAKWYWSLQNITRLATWVVFWVNMWWSMDAIVNSATLYNFDVHNATDIRFVTWSADKVSEVGHVCTLAAVAFTVAAFFCGVVVEYNVRVGHIDDGITMSDVFMCKASLVVWALLELIVITFGIFYWKALHGFDPLSLLHLLRLSLLVLIGFRFRQVSLIEARLRSRNKERIAQTEI